MRASVSPEEQLLGMTREMFACAEAADWDQLAKLEHSRLAIFDRVFSKGVSGCVELAEEVLSIDKKTKLLAEARMPELRHEISLMQHSGKANMVYKSIQSLNPGDV